MSKKIKIIFALSLAAVASAYLSDAEARGERGGERFHGDYHHEGERGDHHHPQSFQGGHSGQSGARWQGGQAGSFHQRYENELRRGGGYRYGGYGAGAAAAEGAAAGAAAGAAQNQGSGTVYIEQQDDGVPYDPYYNWPQQ